MCIDEARQKKAAAQVHGRDVRMRLANTRVVTARGDAPIANQEAAIGVAFECARISKGIARGVKQGRAQQFAPWRGDHRMAPTEPTCASRSARARCIAKKARSGLAGL